MTGSTTSGWSSAAKRGQALDRHAEPNRHARHRHEFGPAGSDRCRLTRPDAFAAETAAGFGEPAEIAIDVPAQALGEVIPGRPGLGLDGRLGEPLQRPAVDCTRAGIPRSAP